MTRRLFALGAGVALSLVSLLAIEVPRKAPELAVPLPNGKQVLLSQYRGKVVVIAFVHTTCPHCQHAAVLLERLYKELGPKGLQPLAVAFNDNAAMLVPDFVKQTGVTFPVGTGTRDEVINYLQFPLVRPMYVPQIVIVDRKGIIRAQYSGEEDFFRNLEPNLRAAVEPLLKEPAERARRRSRPHKTGSEETTARR